MGRKKREWRGRDIKYAVKEPCLLLKSQEKVSLSVSVVIQEVYRDAFIESQVHSYICAIQGDKLYIYRVKMAQVSSKEYANF